MVWRFVQNLVNVAGHEAITQGHEATFHNIEGAVVGSVWQFVRVVVRSQGEVWFNNTQLVSLFVG